jgi:hypothetical protein
MDEKMKNTMGKKLVKNWILAVNPKKMEKLSFLLSIVLIASGLVSYYMMNSIKEFTFRYDHKCFNKNLCNMDINLNGLKRPVYLFLQMDNFFQSHKNFVEGFSRVQLAGNSISMKYAKSKCRKAFIYKNFDVDHSIFKPDDIANPCGLLSKYFPGDMYLSLKNKETDETTKIKTNNIADYFFKKAFVRSSSESQWLDVTKGQFINWMVC